MHYSQIKNKVMETQLVNYSKSFEAYLTREQIDFEIVNRGTCKMIRFECPSTQDLFDIAVEFGKSL